MAVLAALVLTLLAASSLLLQRARNQRARSAQALDPRGQSAIGRCCARRRRPACARPPRPARRDERFVRGHARLRPHRARRAAHEPVGGRPHARDGAAHARLRSGRAGCFGARHRRKDARARRRGGLPGRAHRGRELLFCSSRDVTERRAQARELERYRDHLETLVAERTEAVARLECASARSPNSRWSACTCSSTTSTASSTRPSRPSSATRARRTCWTGACARTP